MLIAYYSDIFCPHQQLTSIAPERTTGGVRYHQRYSARPVNELLARFAV